MKHIHSNMKWILPAMTNPGTPGVFVQPAVAIAGTSPDPSQLKYAPGRLPLTGQLPGANDSRQDLRPGETGADDPANTTRSIRRKVVGIDYPEPYFSGSAKFD